MSKQTLGSTRVTVDMQSVSDQRGLPDFAPSVAFRGPPCIARRTWRCVPVSAVCSAGTLCSAARKRPCICSMPSAKPKAHLPLVDPKLRVGVVATGQACGLQLAQAHGSRESSDGRALAARCGLLSILAPY
eukprot:3004570-Prymnesium_polylepis.2